MKALKIIAIILLALVLIGAIVVSMQPKVAHVEKSIVINAPPAAVFKAVNSFKSMREWSPWAKMDPTATYTFEGPEEGVEAKMSWDGEETGRGSQWIEESVENQKVKTALSFEGQDGYAYAAFTIAPSGGGTTLTWTFDGINDGMTGKARWMVMGGRMNDWYTQGLNDLKTYVEAQPVPTDATKINP